MPNDWCLKILTTEFVRWGYGPGTFETGMHTDRAVIHLADPGDPIYPLDIEFELPAEGRIGKPTLYGRRRMVGWRFQFREGFHNTGWRLAETEEAALVAARAYADRYAASRGHDRDLFVEALERVIRQAQ